MRTTTTTAATMIQFLACLAHVVVYWAGIALLRTDTIVIGFGCQTVLTLTLLGLV